MIRNLTFIAVAVVVSACSNGELNSVTGSGAQLQAPELGAAVAELSNTSELEADRDFDFASARSIDIDFDIEDARDSDGSVSICTDYQSGGDAFDVDYESCTVSAPMQDGQFSHTMQVTNEHDSVVAVVWFQDAEQEPLYREFFVEQTTRSKLSAGRPTISWK